MAFIVYRKSPAGSEGAVQIFATEAETPKKLPEYGTYGIYEYPFDPNTERLTSLKLNDAGTGLVNEFAGKTIQEQEDLHEAQHAAIRKEELRAERLQQIKTKARERIEAYNWKLERAREIDLANGNNDQEKAIAQERQAIRDGNNQREAELNALTDYQDIFDFDPFDFAGKGVPGST